MGVGNRSVGICAPRHGRWAAAHPYATTWSVLPCDAIHLSFRLRDHAAATAPAFTISSGGFLRHANIGMMMPIVAARRRSSTARPGYVVPKETRANPASAYCNHRGARALLGHIPTVPPVSQLCYGTAPADAYRKPVSA